MKVGLIDVDGHNYPNLPLMKLSAWHKQQGDAVRWYDPWDGLCDPYDIVYKSKVFSFTPDYEHPIYAEKVVGGGTGYCIYLKDGREVYDKSKDSALPDEVEHIMPDYSLYGITDTAYGFLSRGCPRKCSFCHVAAKEGKGSRKVADLSEFWHGQKNIVLCDPNILACPEHLDLLRQLADSKAYVDFNQGLDIRLVTERNLEIIKKVKLKTIHFAFDRWEDRDLIVPKLRAFRDATGYGRSNVFVYILCNFDTTIEQDLERIKIVRSLNFQPYPMIYDKEHCDVVYKQIQRWCSPYIFWKVPEFMDYV